MTINTDGWTCPQHPVSHRWAEDKLRCLNCGHVRPAAEAVLSILSDSRACSDDSARLLLDAVVAEAAPSAPQPVSAARALLTSMFNLSERDEAEFDARVDAVVAAETAALQAQVAAVRAFATSHEYRWLHELLDGNGTHGGHL